MKKYLLTTALTVSLMASPALANERDQDLQAQIDMLKSQIAQQADLIQSLESEMKKPRRHAKRYASSSRRSSDSTSGFAVTKKEGLVFGEGDSKFTIKPSVRIQADAAFSDDDINDYADGTTLRRARAGFKGTYGDAWSYALIADFANDGTNVQDAYLRYHANEKAFFTVGNHKEPRGLEALTSSANLTFLEYSLGTYAQKSQRSIGLSADYHGDYAGISAGIFGDDVGDVSSDDEGWSYVGRVYATPFNDKKGLLVHLGANIDQSIPDQATPSAAFGDRPESRVVGDRIVYTGTISNVNTLTSYGAEFAAGYGPFSLQAEYVSTDIDRDNAPDADIDGGYVYATLFLTDDYRPYKKGKFGGVKPSDPFSLSPDGGIGAWELAARYSNLDLNDGTVLTGGEYDGYTLGVNWYPNDHIRFMANYVMAESDQNGVTPNDEPDIFMLRAQFNY